MASFKEDIAEVAEEVANDIVKRKKHHERHLHVMKEGDQTHTVFDQYVYLYDERKYVQDSFSYEQERQKTNFVQNRAHNIVEKVKLLMEGAVVVGAMASSVFIAFVTASPVLSIVTCMGVVLGGAVGMVVATSSLERFFASKMEKEAKEAFTSVSGELDLYTTFLETEMQNIVDQNFDECQQFLMHKRWIDCPLVEEQLARSTTNPKNLKVQAEGFHKGLTEPLVITQRKPVFINARKPLSAMKKSHLSPKHAE